MRVCIISKYPPIEGGVSSYIYWLARSLGERNHQVFVVTNASEVEDDYRLKIERNEEAFLEPKNVKIFPTNTHFSSPILDSKYFCERLANLAVKVVRDYDADLIYSEYLLPYSVAGYLCKKLTGRPHMVAHAGSDIGRLIRLDELKTLLSEILLDADLVLGNIEILNALLPDLRFSPYQKSKSVPPYFNDKVEPLSLSPYGVKSEEVVFTYIGKVSKMKKTYSFVKALERIQNMQFKVLFVIGTGIQALRLINYVESIGLGEKCAFIPFQAPWRIPAIIRASTCIVSPEDEEPFVFKKCHNPMIPREALACGRTAIIGKGVHKKWVYNSCRVGDAFFVIDPTNILQFSDTLRFVLENGRTVYEMGKRAAKLSKDHEDFNRYVDNIEKCMSNAIRK